MSTVKLFWEPFTQETKIEIIKLHNQNYDNLLRGNLENVDFEVLSPYFNLMDEDDVKKAWDYFYETLDETVFGILINLGAWSDPFDFYPDINTLVEKVTAEANIDFVHYFITGFADYEHKFYKAAYRGTIIKDRPDVYKMLGEILKRKDKDLHNVQWSVYNKSTKLLSYIFEQSSYRESLIKAAYKLSSGSHYLSMREFLYEQAKVFGVVLE